MARMPKRHPKPEALDLLEALHPADGIFTLDTYEVLDGNGGTRPAPKGEKIRTMTSAEGALILAHKLDAEERYPGIYFRVSELAEAPADGKRGTEADTIRAYAAWCDLDAKDAEGKRDKPKARQFLTAAVKGTRVPKPSAIVDSGGGLQGYWFLEKPAAGEDLPLLKAVNRRLGLRVSGDTTHDLARVLRVPGTHNRKPEYGEPAPCVLEELDVERRYNLRDLARTVGLDPDNPEDLEPLADEAEEGLVIDFNAEVPEAWKAYLDDGRRTRARGLWEGTSKPKVDSSRSGYAFAIVNHAIKAGITKPEELGAIVAAAPSCKDYAREKPKGLARTIRKALETRGPRKEEPDRPTVYVTTRMDKVVDAAVETLRKGPDGHGIYQRAGMLCRVTREPASSPRWLRRAPRAPVVEPLRVEALREKLSKAANWVKVSEEEIKPTLVPKWAAETLAARGAWPFRLLEAVTGAPVLRPDGSLWTHAGYDSETGLWCDLDRRMEALADKVPERPDRDRARKALDYLADPFRDFPFKDGSDRAACLAAILSIVGRHLVEGPCPLFAVRAPAAGTGKTLLADAVSLIATGRAAARVFPGKDDEEDRKRILAVALEAPPVVLIDNVERVFGSAPLSAALTGREIKDRLLGLNRMVTAPVSAVWLATGNNLAVRGDLGRRVVPVDLDAEVELPEERAGFEYPDLLRHVRGVRPELTAACLTVLRAWLQFKGKRPELTPFGSFEAWSRTIRELLVWLGEADPCGGRVRIREEGDIELDALRSLLVAWHAEFPDLEVTVRVLLDRAKQLAEKGRTDLRDALPAPARGGGDPTPRSLGYFLRKYRGRIVAGLRLGAGGKRMGGKAWIVRRVV